MNNSQVVLLKDLSESIKVLSKEMVQTLLDKKQPYLYQETTELFYKNNSNKNNPEKEVQIEAKTMDKAQNLSLSNSMYSLGHKSNNESNNELDENQKTQRKSNLEISLYKVKPSQVTKYSKKEGKEINNLGDVTLLENITTQSRNIIINQSESDSINEFNESELESYSLKQKTKSFYEKSMLLQQKKIKKLQNLRYKEMKNEIQKYKAKPQMNIKSKEILEKKFRDYIPLYERAVQLHKQQQMNLLLQDKIYTHKELKSNEEYFNKRKAVNNTKKDINDFVTDQFEWKKRICFKNKMKEVYQNIKKEMETEKLLNKNTQLRNNKAQTDLIYIKLYLDHKVRDNKKLKKEKEDKPSFNPTINQQKSNRNNKSNLTRVPIYYFNNFSFSKLNSLTNRSVNKSDKHKSNTQRTQYISKCINRQSNQNRTSIIYKNSKKYVINFKFEADCFNLKKYAIIKNNGNNNERKIKRKPDLSKRDSSWHNELELVSSAPSSKDYIKYYHDNKKDSTFSSQKKLYKLNISDSSSNGYPKQQTIVNTKGLFNKLFKP